MHNLHNQTRCVYKQVISLPFQYTLFYAYEFESSLFLKLTKFKIHWKLTNTKTIYAINENEFNLYLHSIFIVLIRYS